MTNPKLILIAIAVVTAIVLLYVIYLLWWELPKLQVSQVALGLDQKARADVEDNFRKTVGQALGGAAVLFGAAFALFQFLQQQKAAHDLLISNQVSKGFEQLAGDKIAMRLGGIYALEGVMNTSEQYHWAVLEGLCAFVRENPAKNTPLEDVGQHDAPIKTATDVQAALTVIGRRVMRWEGTKRIDLAHVKIHGAILTDANLTGANLFHASLGANLTGADLSRSILKDANLKDANLTGAILIDARLPGAILTGANLTGANLTGAMNLTQEQLDVA